MPSIRSTLRLLAVFSICLGCFAQPADPTTLDGKVLLGYQGWFRCPGPGWGTNWSHWTSGPAPSAASLVIDMYPDLREFDPAGLCVVPGMDIGGKPAYLFSSANANVVARHFAWMQEYGLDGVLVQRFITDIPGNRAAGDPVLKNVMAAAAQSGRVFAIEYDISGARSDTLVTNLQQDWDYLVNTLRVTSQPNYLRHNGKPVVSIWGPGFTGNHPPEDPQVALQLIGWFKTTAQVTYVGGTPAYWGTLSNDARTDPGWTAVYQAMDVIQPWTVGRYNNIAGIDRWKTNQIQRDLDRTAQANQLYMPVVFPGFSWYNLQHAAQNAPQNQIPRLRGEFLWRQAYQAKLAGARMLKIAMFDEVNEGTAMFKVASHRADAPAQGYWLTLDADGFNLPSDWYLRLAGEITRLFHGLSEPVSDLPANPGPPWPGKDGKPLLTVVSAASFEVGTLAAEAIATLGGTGLAADTQAAPGLPLPLEMAGTRVTVIDSEGVGRPAPLFYVSATQINFQVPAGAIPGAASILVTSGDGAVASGGSTIAAVAPGIFSADSSGQGVAAAFALLVHPDGTRSSAPVFSCSAPGKCLAAPMDLGAPGDRAFLELYGTGIRGRSSLEGVLCTIAGTPVPVLYAGTQGLYPGQDQVNLELPRSLAGKGEARIQLTVDGLAANPVLIQVR